VHRYGTKTTKKHSVLLVGDSHIRGVAERLAIKLRISYRTIGYVIPNAYRSNITLIVKSEIKNLSKNDVVVLCGNTLDVAKNNTSIGLSFILQFVKNTEHTNVSFLDARHRFYLEASSCVNKEINVFNRK
jgi:NADH:ubiquinone oxidoreductase subunit K